MTCYICRDSDMQLFAYHIFYILYLIFNMICSTYIIILQYAYEKTHPMLGAAPISFDVNNACADSAFQSVS